MKKVIFLSLLLLSCYLSANQLILIDVGDFAETKQLFLNTNLKIHFYNDALVIATTDIPFTGKHAKICDNPWDFTGEYFLYQFTTDLKQRELEKLSAFSENLLTRDTFAIIRVDTRNTSQLNPAVHGGIVRIRNREAKLPKSTYNLRDYNITEDPFITGLLADVSTANLQSNVQHLEDYETRNCYREESIEAQNWIAEQYELLGLDVQIQDFYMPGGFASDNVLAYQTGTLYPDEYIVLGGHYDSIVSGGNQLVAPGSDDNASGTCGVMEIARILSQFEFDRSIIYCAFSGEEYGLYGSQEFAENAAVNNLNILGYFNMDMAGYLNPGDEIHTDMIAPESAEELVNFYVNVCAVYLPNFPIEPGMLVGGDSDHTSFNNNGYMGIFPFEDVDFHSPYIHTTQDLIGPSLNSFEMHATFTKAMLACVATMADMFTTTSEFSALPGDSVVNLNWSQADQAIFYRIYRDNLSEFLYETSALSFQDTLVVNGTNYHYFLAAVNSDGVESISMAEASAMPLPSLSFPCSNDFESGINGLYTTWLTTGNWDLTTQSAHSGTHSLTDSPNGEYEDDSESSACFRWFDLQNAISADLSFWAKYDLESGYDYVYLQISTDGDNWTTLESYNGHSDWLLNFVNLDEYAGESYLLIRFYFISDTYVTEDGFYLDDMQISAEVVSTDNNNISGFSQIIAYPNPFNPTINFSINLTRESKIELCIFNILGQKVASIPEANYSTGTHIINWKADNDLSSGVYLYRIISDKEEEKTGKIVLLK